MSRSLRLFASLAAFAAFVGLPGLAAGCPVCIGADEESRDAFIYTTVLLSVLPPGLIGGLVWWIWRRSRAQEADRERALAAVSNAA